MAEKDEEQEGEKWGCQSFLVCVCHLDDFWEFDGFFCFFCFFVFPSSSVLPQMTHFGEWLYVWFFLLQNWMWREKPTAESEPIEVWSL